MEMNDQIASVSAEAVMLGRLTHANHIFCQLEPVAELVEGRWAEIDRHARLPKNGSVRTTLTSLANPRAQVGSFWVFGTRTKGPEADPVATDPVRAMLLIDLSEIPLAEARRKLLETGVTLPDHQSRQVIVLLEDDLFCSLKFVQSEKRPHAWVARLQDEAVPLRRAGVRWKDSYKAQGAGLFAPIRGEPDGDTVRVLDWSSDGVFLSRVANRFSTAVKGFTEVSGKSGAGLVRKLERALAGGKIGADESAELHELAERLRGDWSNLSRGLDALATIGALLLESDDGKRLLEETVALRAKDLQADIEQRLQTEIGARLAPLKTEAEQLVSSNAELSTQKADVEEELRKLRRQSEEAKKSTARAETELDDLRQKARDLRESSDVAQQRLNVALEDASKSEASTVLSQALLRDLREELASFASRISDEFESSGSADSERLSAFARRLQSRLSGDGHAVSIVLPSASPPWWSGAEVATTSVRINDLRGRLKAEAELHGIVHEDLYLLDGFARSGEPVVISGPQSELAIEAYSRVISGGQVRVQAIDPSVVGIDDLWKSPISGRPTAFAWAWQRAASQAEQTILVCLRSIDASPLSLWASSLSAILRSANRPRNLVVVATTSDREIDTEECDRNAWIRHHLVGLRPGFRADASLAPAILGDLLPPPTTLTTKPGDDRPLSQTAFTALLELAKKGGQPRDVGRIARVLKALVTSDPQRAPTIVSAWFSLLGEGSSGGLPRSVAAGDADLLKLELRN